ncbi:MAG TPA: helix-turn-helix domain-containing protein [Dehalococcoidia bacterium]|nr:helix-turn-helix domain-containing protein [Dehalococcoidia bacterium]
MQATRQEILGYLRRHGEATVKELGDLLGLTSTGIRQHLTVLERDGLVQVRETRGRVGRPALVYSLTPSGLALFPNRHDDLANLLLTEIRAIAGSQGLQSVLMRVAARSAEPYEPRVRGLGLAARVSEAAAIINERGCLAETEASGDEFLIHQFTCPFPNVARYNSGVCAMEVEFVRRLTGGDARLVRSLLRGDKSCTYRVREPS